MCLVHSQLRSPYEYICKICNKKGCVACYENPGYCNQTNKHKFVYLSQSTLINLQKEHRNSQKNTLNNKYTIVEGITTRELPKLPQRHNPSSTSQAAYQHYIPPNTEEVEIKVQSVYVYIYIYIYI